MIEYIYSKEIGNKGEKYYVIYGEIKSQELAPIITYCDLVGVSLIDAFNYRWGDDKKIRELFGLYGAWYVSIDRTIIKEMKKLGLIEAQYKYKKKKDK